MTANSDDSNSSDKKVEITTLSKLLRHAESEEEIAEATKIWHAEVVKAGKIGNQARLNMLLGAIGRVTFRRSPILKLQQLYYQGRLYALAKQFEEAETTYRQGLAYIHEKLSGATEDVPLSAQDSLYWRVAFSLALSNTLASKPAAATSEAEQLLDNIATAPVLNEIELAWHYHFTLSIINYNRGNLAKSIEHSQQALELAKGCDEPLAVANISNNLAVYYMASGQWDKALPLLKESINIRQSIGAQRLTGLSYANIAIIYIQMGRYQDALDNYKLALTIFELNNNSLLIGKTEREIGGMYNLLEQSSKALVHLQKAITIYESLQLRWELIRTIVMAGESARLSGRIEEASNFMRRALELAEQPTEDGAADTVPVVDQAQIYLEVGKLLSHLGKETGQVPGGWTEKAHYYLSQSLSRFEQIGTSVDVLGVMASNLAEYNPVEALALYGRWRQEAIKLPPAQLKLHTETTLDYITLLLKRNDTERALEIYRWLFNVTNEKKKTAIAPVEPINVSRLAKGYEQAARLTRDNQEILDWLENALELYESSPQQFGQEIKKLEEELGKLKKNLKGYY
jgi:tetratricopeptide (TPR) repeat protein